MEVILAPPLTRPPMVGFPPSQLHDTRQSAALGIDDTLNKMPRSHRPSPLQIPAPVHKPSVTSFRSFAAPISVDSPHSDGISIKPLRSAPLPGAKQVRIKTPSPSPVDRSVSPMSFQPPSHTLSVAVAPAHLQPSPTSSIFSVDSGADAYYDEHGNLMEVLPSIEVSAAFYDELPDLSESELGGAPARSYSPVQVIVTPDTLKVLEQLPIDEADAYLARGRRPSTASSGGPSKAAARERWRTASFIPAYDYAARRKDDLEVGKEATPDTPEEQDAFKFEGLPPRLPRALEHADADGAPGPTMPLKGVGTPALSEPFAAVSPRSNFSPYSSHDDLPPPVQARSSEKPTSRWNPLVLVGGLQERCSKALLGRQARLDAASAQAPRHTRSHSLPSIVASLSEKRHAEHLEQAPNGTRHRLREMLTVPAFRSPLTRVLSPVVTRAQWEIVVRSGLISGAVSISISAGLLAIPVL